MLDISENKYEQQVQVHLNDDIQNQSRSGEQPGCVVFVLTCRHEIWHVVARFRAHVRLVNVLHKQRVNYRLTVSVILKVTGKARLPLTLPLPSLMLMLMSLLLVRPPVRYAPLIKSLNQAILVCASDRVHLVMSSNDLKIKLVSGWGTNKHTHTNI